MKNNNDNDIIELLAVGDVMLGDSPYCFGHGVASSIDRHGPRHPFARVSQRLNEGDLVVGNLEIPISAHDRGKDPFDSLIYRGQPQSVAALAEAGFHVFSAATNHTMQHGRAALEETLGLLKKNNLLYSGVVIEDRQIANHCFLERRGRKFGFLNYNFRPQQYFVDPPQWATPDLELIKDDIESVKDQTDILIVSLHWGDEFINYPSPGQRELAHSLVDCGVNIILGHHPHIVQGVERYRQSVIAYSLGNFVFDLWQCRLRKSMILRCAIKDSTNIDYEIIPVMINRHHQPEICDGAAGLDLKRELDDLTVKIAASETDRYEHDLNREFKRFRREIYTYYFRNLYRYNPRMLAANFLGAINKRL